MHSHQKRGFTLIELLVVIAIIAILAAILFPVFAQARAKARQATCLSNFRQQSLGVNMYQQDYDELMPLIQTGGTYKSPPDTEIGQIIQPYLKNLQIYDCPSDPVNDTGRASIEVSYPPTTQQQREFNLATKNDFGINWQYLCPVVVNTGSPSFLPVPTALASIGSPAQTILAVDCLWDRDASGNTVGGGNAAVDPPCRYYSDGKDSFPVQKSYPGYYWYGAWAPSQPLAWNVFGGVWAWHTDFVNTAFCDGHVKSLKINALTAGCSVKDAWGGAIVDKSAYMWDLQ